MKRRQLAVGLPSRRALRLLGGCGAQAAGWLRRWLAAPSRAGSPCLLGAWRCGACAGRARCGGESQPAGLEAGFWMEDSLLPLFKTVIWGLLPRPPTRSHAPLSSLWDARASSDHGCFNSARSIPEHILTFPLLCVTVD